MINNVTMMGRLTKDPELRVTGNDVKVTSFSIAVERYVGKDKPKEVNFFDVEAWRNTAEYITRYFRKGSLIVVQGSLKTTEYTTQNGQKRKNVVIVADEVGGFNSRSAAEKAVAKDIANAVAAHSQPVETIEQSHMEAYPEEEEYEMMREYD